ncbi:hypothetical protein PIIN_01433 [Serendipita indica DSM 11827]|uniref:Uncharacterized protein n=1 Tax=Serendipita indica (strain DSM 11827) TaxID=1109443 RepID=G4T8G4_SERID|nr:hypothetical protein PIIN_01433 [Serendipita indica DSM 11827]
MTLSVDRAVPILPMGQYPPPGVPIGTHAFMLKMTPEALQELANQLAAHQPAAATTSTAGTGPGSAHSNRPRQSGESQKKHDKPLMQLVVSESGQPQFIIGDTTFRADATTEPSTTEIYARHQSPLSDSDQLSSEAGSSNPLQMVAKVDGRLRMMRDFTPIVQQSVSERTAKLNKEAQPRSAIILDAPGSYPNSSSKAGARAQQTKVAATAKSALPSGTAGTVRPSEQRVQVFTPPKSDGSPSSATSGSRGPKHTIPDAFGTLDLSIPTRWDGQISIPIRIIHWAALKPKTEAELLSEAVSRSEYEQGRRAISILCESKEDGSLSLRDEAFYYLRPWAWVNYTPTNRSEVAKFTRIALRRLGYDDQDEAWENLRKPGGWVDPWRNTPEGILHYREKEQRRATSVITSKEERDKQKAEALANPAPMLTSTIKPGFFTSKPAPVVAKVKKASKEKEPKVKKASTSSEQENPAPPKIAHSASQSSTSSSAVPSNSTPNVEPSIYESELRVRQSGPGSKAGKMAVAKRIQREKEEGFASTVSTPSRSPLPLPSETRKRKALDDDYEDVGKRKKTHPLPLKPSAESFAGSSSKKRKGDNIDALSPPTKMRKSELSSVHAPSTSASPGVSTKKTSATRDYTGKKAAMREDWDYSSEDGDDRPLSKRTSSATHRNVRSLKDEARLKPPSSSSSPPRRVATPTPHRMPPPTTYLGYKAVYMQKWSEYSMVLSVIMGEEAKLESIRVGDDSSALMGLDELRSYIKKRSGLEAELKDLKREIARLAPKASASSSTV